MIDTFQLETIESVLMGMGVLQTNGHFEYTSKRHGTDYCAKELLIATKPEELNYLARMVTLNLSDLGFDFDAVAGPVFGGAIFAHEIRKILNLPLVPLEKFGDGFIVKPPYQKHLRDKSVLYVDDVLNHGVTLFRSARAIADCGGSIMATTAIFSYGRITSKEAMLPVMPLLVRHSPSFQRDECPMCQQGIPINTEFGHGH